MSEKKKKKQKCPHLSEGVALAASKKKSKGKETVSVQVKKKTLDYEEQLYHLQVELLKLQNHVKDQGLRLLMLFEGRDAAGKGGAIKRFTEHLNPRGARVVALNKPSDIEQGQWYFQRYVAQLPAAGEMVFFDRSWYNRAMVESVMGFCTDEQNKRFLKDVPLFEQMLVKDGIHLFKFYFSVSKEEQARRFNERRKNPLKQFKLSPVDESAQSKWRMYTVKKFQMLTESNRSIAPWTIIRSDDKKPARLNVIKSVLQRMEYPGKCDESLLMPDPEIVVSGIDEILYMENHLRSEDVLPG